MRSSQPKGTRTYAGTLGALEEATEALERAMTVIDHLESVATTDALRAAYNATRPKVSAFWSELAMNDGLYQAVRAFSETDEAACVAIDREAVLEEDPRRLSAAWGRARRTKTRRSSRQSRSS